MTFGKWLKQKRESLGLSPNSFGNLIGVAPAVVRELERSNRKPRKKTLLALEKHFGELDLPPNVALTLSPTFKRMSASQLLDTCREMVRIEGVSSLSYPSLKKKRGLYFALYDLGMSQKVIIKKLGLEAEYKSYRESTWTRKHKNGTVGLWTWPKIIAQAKAIQEHEGFLPTADWFKANGKGGLVQAVYNLGKNWEVLRDELGDFKTSAFVESRNGIRWRSHPEASFSNFLYARGIEHKRGEKYPDEYARQSHQSYGYFDLHFQSSARQWVDVEIWGEKPLGHDEQGYAQKRAEKENFNRSNKLFLGINFRDCFSEEKLTRHLAPYIGTVKPFIFKKTTDNVIPSTHWSNSDELIGFCRRLASEQSDGVFPSEGWLRKRGRFKNRPGEPYNTASVYIKTWLGGIRKLREILGQADKSTKVWTRETAIAAYKDWFERYEFTAEQARAKHKTGDSSLSVSEYRTATNICSAVYKLIGGTAKANKLLDLAVNRQRRWTKESVQAFYTDLWSRFQLIPPQVVYLHRKGLLPSSLTAEEVEVARNVIDGAKRLFGSPEALHTTLGIHPATTKQWILSRGFALPKRKKRTVRR